MKGLISYAVQKGHLSSRYIQPLLVKGEKCLVPPQKARPKKGENFRPVGHPSRPLHHEFSNTFGSGLFPKLSLHSS
jgi:hypothetical protein